MSDKKILELENKTDIDKELFVPTSDKDGNSYSYDISKLATKEEVDNKLNNIDTSTPTFEIPNEMLLALNNGENDIYINDLEEDGKKLIDELINAIENNYIIYTQSYEYNEKLYFNYIGYISAMHVLVADFITEKAQIFISDELIHLEITNDDNSELKARLDYYGQRITTNEDKIVNIETDIDNLVENETKTWVLNAEVTSTDLTKINHVTNSTEEIKALYNILKSNPTKQKVFLEGAGLVYVECNVINIDNVNNSILLSNRVFDSYGSNEFIININNNGECSVEIVPTFTPTTKLNTVDEDGYTVTPIRSIENIYNFKGANGITLSDKYNGYVNYLEIGIDDTIATKEDLKALDNKPFIVVESLPNQPIEGNENKIHLVLINETSTLIKEPTIEGSSPKIDNKFAEYLWVNNQWEKLGEVSADIDFSEIEDRLPFDKKLNNSQDSFILNLKNAENTINYEKIGKTIIVGWNNTNDGYNYGSFLSGQNNSMTNSNYSHISGGSNKIIESNNSANEGYNNQIAASNNSHAEGSLNNISSNSNNSHVEGCNNTMALSSQSHAEGLQNNIIESSNSHIEGSNNKIENSNGSHVEGYYNNISYSNNSHVSGYGNKLEYASHSTAAGYSNEIFHSEFSHIAGSGNIISYLPYSHASGIYNKITNYNHGVVFGSEYKTIFSIGNGTSQTTRHNAFEVRQNGDIYVPDTSNKSNYYEKPMVKLCPIGDVIKENEICNVENVELSTTNPTGWVYQSSFYEPTQRVLKLNTKYHVIITELNINSVYISKQLSGESYIAITDSNKDSISSPFEDDSTFTIYSSTSGQPYLTIDAKYSENITVNIQIFEITEETKKIDSKYLPTPSPEPNQILYKTTDNKPLDMSSNVYYGTAKLISNEYFGDYGLLTFDEDLETCPGFASKYNLKYLELPEGVKHIISGCFNNNLKLETVVLPESLEDIPTPGFMNCQNLKEINIPNNIIELPQQCFANTYALSHLNFNNVEIIRSTALQYSGITTLGNHKIKEVENNAFYNSNLISLDTGSIEKIGISAFSNCKNLISVVFGSSLMSLDSSAFYSCTSLTNVNMKYNTKLKMLPTGCFNSCSSLNEISIDENIEALGGSCFYYCPLRSITVHSSKITNYNASFGNSLPNLEYFYTRSSAPLTEFGQASTIKTIILDTPNFVTIVGSMTRFKNFTTIYVQEDLLEQYQTTYSDFSWLFKPITGNIPGNNDNSWTGTETEYELLEEYDPNTIYYIIEEDEQL